MACVLAPEVALEQRLELGGEEAHLRGELAELLADELESVGELGAQEDDRVAEREAVLGRPERDDVDTAVGGERLERDAERGGGAREAGTVDVEQHAELVGPLGDRAGLLERVDGPELRRLGDRDDALLGVVVVAAAGLPAAEVVGRELPVLGGDGVELGAGDPLGCAALVGCACARCRCRSPPRSRA